MKRTFEEYISRIFHITEEDKKRGSGRFLMRTLGDYHYDLYWEITNKRDLDPRWSVDNIPAFIDFLIENWEKY